MVEQSSEEIRDGIDAVLCYPIDNTSWVAESSRSKYERLSLKDICVHVDDMSVVIDLGAHGHILCSALQFKTWYEPLKGEIEDVVDRTNEEDVLMSNRPPTQKRTVFGVQAKALYNVRPPDIYHGDLGETFLYHISVAECTIHFWRKLPDTEMLQRVDYNAQREVPSGHLGFTNVVTNISCLLRDEILWHDDHSESGRKPMVNPEQNGISLMKELVHKFLKPG